MLRSENRFKIGWHRALVVSVISGGHLWKGLSCKEDACELLVLNPGTDCLSPSGMRLAKSSEKRIAPFLGPAEGPSPKPSPDIVRLPKKTNYGFSSRRLTTPPGPKLSQDHSHLTLPIFTVYSALYHNGVILGIPCTTSNISKSRPATAHVPAPLRPLQIQLEHVHYSFIDRMPHKALRHNMISLSDNFNVENFTADLFTMPSFIIAPGSQSWDPSGWSVAPDFRKKWSLLFESKAS